MLQILNEDGLFHLRNDRMSYVMKVLDGGILMHLYLGGRLESCDASPWLAHAGVRPGQSFTVQNCGLDMLPQELPQYGLGDFRRGALTVRRSDGTRTCDLRFVGSRVVPGKPALEGLPATFGDTCQTLVLTLRDEALSLACELRYTIFEDCDVIARSMTLTNESVEPLTLERAMSLCLDLPDSGWDLITLSGAWARERSVIHRALVPGEQGVYSLRGASSAQASPFMALVRPETTEASGEAIGTALVWSGSFHAGVEVDSNSNARVLLGLHDDHFSWKLEPGASFTVPEAVTCWS